MIGPGWMPRPHGGSRKRTLAYTRGRAKRKSFTPHAPAVQNDLVIFDHDGEREFPVATVRRAGVAGVVAELERWLVARWAWFRPRTVPVLVAALGAVLFLAAADYLTHGHGAMTKSSRAMLVP